MTGTTPPLPNGAVAADGPSEPKGVTRDRGISVKVLMEVEKLKDRLKEVLKVIVFALGPLLTSTEGALVMNFPPGLVTDLVTALPW